MAGGPINLVEQDRARVNPGKPPRARGKVVRAPSDLGGTMLVQLIGYSSHYSYEIVGTNWAPRMKLEAGGDADWVPDIPVHGDVCCVVFDHLGDAWVGSMWGHA